MGNGILTHLFAFIKMLEARFLTLPCAVHAKTSSDYSISVPQASSPGIKNSFLRHRASRPPLQSGYLRTDCAVCINV